jgi:CxxC-x17-CxxC domain-containing protein
MSFTDKTLQCTDCGAEFTFTVGEQEFFASKGFTNEPRRCTDCRRSRKQDQGGYGGGGYQRRMYPAVCAECGIDTEVPFEPRENRPVYCSTCFSSVGSADR